MINHLGHLEDDSHTMLLKFTKMYGLKNSFIVIDAVSQAVIITPELAQKLGDRHSGIGCDQQPAGRAAVSR